MAVTDAPTNTPRWFDWLFRDRETGDVVIVQWPNVPLWVFLVASVVRRIGSPSGAAGTALSAVITVSLGIWATLEIGWGANPWRRALGALVLVAAIARLAA